MLGRWRERQLRLLEIGVGGYFVRKMGGASLAMWADYFPHGIIVGIDIAEKDLDLGPRVKILQGSQIDKAFLTKVVTEHGPFDIIIDDGSHVPEHVVTSFDILFPTLLNPGIYIIEDVGTAFRPDYHGTPEGAQTYQLANLILRAIHYAEINATAPTSGAPAIGPMVRAFHAYHNVFVVEKGDNREPKLAGSAPDTAHLLEISEQELARARTAGGIANLADMYGKVGRTFDGLIAVREALATWPDDMALLWRGAELSRSAGDTAGQRHFLERAVALDPEDGYLRRVLARATTADNLAKPPTR
jgi:hypothetical protein